MSDWNHITNMATWQRELLRHRVVELGDAAHYAFSIGNTFYGNSRVAEARQQAIDAVETGELVRAERLCLALEQLIISERRNYTSPEAALATRGYAEAA
jgi:hypothetical protein